MNIETTAEERQLLNQILSHYPILERIVRNNPLLYRKYIDQYSGNIPEEQFEEIAESSIGGIVLGTQICNQFANQLTQLETWLSVYSIYATRGFGDKLVKNFLNHYSEIEVYDALKRGGCYTIDRDIRIGQGNNNLDFSIFLKGKEILIEVVTPRMSYDIETSFQADPILPHAGFFDIERGLQRQPESPYTRVQTIINKKIEQHFQNVGTGFSRPVILIINYRYAYPEIISNLSQIMENDPPGIFHGILMYKERRGEFYSNPRYSLSENEITFFSRLW